MKTTNIAIVARVYTLDSGLMWLHNGQESHQLPGIGIAQQMETAMVLV